MPEYLIEDEKTGRKWSYEGDQPPSVDEVDRIINYGQSGSTLKRMGYEAAAGIVGIGGALSKVGERVSRAVPFGLGASMAEGYRQTAEERTELQKIYGDLAQETGGNRYAGLLAGAAPNILGVATAGGLGTVAGGPVGGYRAMIGMTGLLGFGSKLTEAETAYAEKYKAANPNASDAEVREYARYYATAPAATQALAEMAITAVAPGGTEKLQGLLFKPAVATAAKTVAKTGIKGVMQKGGKVAGGAIGEILEEESTYLVDEAIKWNTYAEDNNPFKTPSEKEISDLTNPDLSGHLNREQAIEKIKGDKFSRFISGAIDTAGVAAFYGGTISAIHNYQSDAAAAYKAQAQGNEKLAAALSEKAEANEDSNIEKLLSSGQAVSFIANFGVNAEGLPVASPTFRSLEELKAFEAKSGIRHVPGSANPLLGLPAPFLDAQMLAALNILADPQTVGTKARLDADEFIKSRISQRDATEQKDLFDTINGTVAKLNEAKILEAKEKEKGKLSSPDIEGKHRMMQEVEGLDKWKAAEDSYRKQLEADVATGKLTDANLAELMAVRRELSAKQRIEMQLKEEGARTGAVMAELSAAAKKFDAQEMRDAEDALVNPSPELIAARAKIDAQRAAESKASQDLPTPTPAATGAAAQKIAPSGMTGEDFELRPELTKPYRSVAMKQGDVVHEGKPGDNHATIAEGLGFPKDLLPGFVTKEGKFVYQYPEDVPKPPAATGATRASTETPAMKEVVDARKLENSLKDVKVESVADTLLEQKAPDAIDPEREALIRAYQARKALRQEASRSRASQSVIFPTLTQPSQTTTQTPSQPAQPAQPAQTVQPVGQVQSAQPVALSDVARETLLPQPGAPKDKLRVWFAKTFDAARGLGSLAHYAIKQGAAYVTQQGDIAQRLNSQMQSAIVNDLGKSELAQGSNALNALDAVLRGTADISILPQGMAAVAKKMIAHRLETRNRLLSLPGNLLTPELRQSIIDNDDYLNRSYELFSNDKWISELDSNKKIAESLAIIVRDKIASVKLATGENITRAQAINEIKAEMTSLRGDDVSVGSGIRRSSPGVTPGVSKFILGKRKNLADAYKVILGEEKDPRVNYINTVMKVAQLTSLHQTLTSVRDIAASRGLISKASDMVEGHTVTLSASDVGKVFEGYRTSEEYAALLTEFTSAMENQGLFKTITTHLSRYAKLNQTAGQLQYTAMQILGNSYSILQSGRISTFLKIPGAAQVLLRKLAGTMTEADYARYSRMLGLNVVEDTPLDLQRDILRKVVYGDSSGLSALMFKFRGSSEKVMSFFKLVDNATKMAAFEAELQTLTEAYPDSSSVELDKMAVIRTADKFPSYSNIPKYIRYITEKTPFAPFLNFFYLANHTFVQSIRYGMLDLKNPKMRINGIKTLAGTAGALMAMDAIKATLQSALGDEITDDEEKVYRSGKQWYERYDDFLFYKKNGQVVGVNLSYANPLSHFRKVAKSIMASAENDDGIVEAGIMASKHLLAPLMSMDIFISSFLNAVRGSDENGNAVWLKSDESVDKISKGIEHIASKVLIPSSIKRGFEKIIPAAEGEGKDKPYEASLKEQLVREFTSLKIDRLNPKVALANQLRTFNGASSEIESNYFSKFLKEGQFYSEKDLLDKYRDMETRRRSLFQKGGKLVGTYVKSGLLEGVDPRLIATDTSVSKLDMQILTGHLKYKPFVLGTQARQDLFKMNRQRDEKGLRPIVVPNAALTHADD